MGSPSNLRTAQLFKTLIKKASSSTRVVARNRPLPFSRWRYPRLLITYDYTGRNTAARYTRRRSRSVRGATRLATATPPVLSRSATCAAHGTQCTTTTATPNGISARFPTSRRPEGARNVTSLHTSYVSASSDDIKQQKTGSLSRRDGAPQGCHSRSANPDVREQSGDRHRDRSAWPARRGPNASRPG